jgi:hypothetical protein
MSLQSLGISYQLEATSVPIFLKSRNGSSSNLIGLHNSKFLCAIRTFSNSDELFIRYLFQRR